MNLCIYGEIRDRIIVVDILVWGYLTVDHVFGWWDLGLWEHCIVLYLTTSDYTVGYMYSQSLLM